MINNADIPLCVDLDGTLLSTDTLQESLILALKERPWFMLQSFRRLFSGRAAFKRELTRFFIPDAATLPLHAVFAGYLKEQRAAGRRLILVTAADQKIADRMAAHLAIFDEVMGSEGTVNLAGARKADALVARFGERQFDYAGNEARDLRVWARARRAVVVGSTSLARRAAAVCEVERVFRPETNGLRRWGRALRVHQWSKNVLLFLPLLGAHAWSNLHEVKLAVLAFLVFCLGASSVYILNDLLDIEADRHHATKRRRPFAAGQIPIFQGILLLGLLLLLALVLAVAWLPPAFSLVFAGYYILTLLYSWVLKRKVLVDVFALALLYCIRVVAGGYAENIVVSQWLLALSIFMFMSLAFAKRYTELAAVNFSKQASIRGRGYQAGDLALVNSMGIAGGYIAVLVLAFYISNPTVSDLYRRPDVLWVACLFVLYWISRVWLLANRGGLHDDPIIFAMRDRQSWLVAVALLLIGWAAGPK